MKNKKKNCLFTYFVHPSFVSVYQRNRIAPKRVVITTTIVTITTRTTDSVVTVRERTATRRAEVGSDGSRVQDGRAETDDRRLGREDISTGGDTGRGGENGARPTTADDGTALSRNTCARPPDAAADPEHERRSGARSRGAGGRGGPARIVGRPRAAIWPTRPVSSGGLFPVPRPPSGSGRCRRVFAVRALKRSDRLRQRFRLRSRWWWHVVVGRRDDAVECSISVLPPPPRPPSVIVIARVPSETSEDLRRFSRNNHVHRCCF